VKNNRDGQRARFGPQNLWRRAPAYCEGDAFSR